MYGAAMSFAYHAYEAVHMMVSPVRGVSDAMHLAFKNPANPLTYTPFGRSVAASCELFERMTRRYGKPAFGLDETTINGVKVAVEERVVWERPFCKLVYFDRKIPSSRRKPQPKVLLVAPMSGHYATLLRGTVEAFLPGHEVYITDWVDARLVPLSEGRFDLNDYIDYVIGMLQMLGPDTHVMAICQPSVPVIAAIARMEAESDPCAPRSMTLMGGPIDTRRSPTAVNQLAMERGTDWFRRNCITVVPFPSLGAFRQVYPGFMQLSAFMSMNLSSHIMSHYEMFKHLTVGDEASAQATKDFYDEYRSVCDMTAEFYLQTVEEVFQKHSIPKGEFRHKGELVDITQITDTALLAIEGERDDISGLGQTKAALKLTPNLPEDKKRYYMAEGAGHYGIFNGSRWRTKVAPVVEEWIAAHAG